MIHATDHVAASTWLAALACRYGGEDLTAGNYALMRKMLALGSNAWRPQRIEFSRREKFFTFLDSALRSVYA